MSVVNALKTLFDDGVFSESYKGLGDLAHGGTVITGSGTVEGQPILVFCFDRAKNGGGVTAASLEKIRKVYETGAKIGAPVVGIYDSNGAIISEGAALLRSYAEGLAASSAISGVVPQISIIAGACGASAAMMALSADLVIMTENAQLFLTPPSLLDSNSAGKAGTASAAIKNGTAAVVVKDLDEALSLCKKMVTMLPANNLAAAPYMGFESGGAVDMSGAFAAAKTLADDNSTVELYGQFGGNVYTALAAIDGATVGIAALKDTLSSDDTAKLARHISFCDAFSLPILTVIDCKGFCASGREETSGSLRGAALLANIYANATSPKIALVVGDAVGGAYLAVSAFDTAFAAQNAVISTLSADAAVTVLYNDELVKGADRTKLVKRYIDEMAGADAALRAGLISDIVTGENVRQVLSAELDLLSGKRVATAARKHSNKVL